MPIEHRLTRSRASAWMGLTTMLGLLAACQCPPDSSDVLSRTREPKAAGTIEFTDFRELGVVFDNAAVRLAELNRGKKGGYCGRRFAAEGGVSDSAIVADLTRQLGPGWLAPEVVASAQSAVKIYRWQSQCSARFYALVTYQDTLVGDGGRTLRPMETVYACGAG